jgi:hypothetical protein
MKIIALLIGIVSFNSFAADCLPQAISTFKKEHPEFVISEVKANGVLKAKAEMPYLQGEIWNSSSKDLRIVEIKSGYMASFVHVALMDPADCRMVNLIEVLFE